MNNKLKIAIYSGDIPSTTFIERLIHGLSNKHKVYLFGFIKKKDRYNQSVSVIGYRNIKVSKLLHLLKYSFLLFFFRYKDKKKLDTYIELNSKNKLLSKVKCYPVLWCKPDIFHLQWAKGIKDWIWVKDFGIKLVLSLRGAHINYSPLADSKLAVIYKEYFPNVDRFHAVSQAIALEAEKYSASKEKIKVVYSGLELKKSKEPVCKNKNVFNIISIGRPHWKKGYTYALDACKILKDKDFNFKYTIVGGAKDIELLYQVKDLELEDKVTLLGQIPFDNVQNMIENANLLLLPSVEEGIANVVLEAMALGTLVLTTDCGGMKEVVIDNKNGFIIPIRDPKVIAKRILDISIISDALEKQLIQEAYFTIKQQHSKEQMINSMTDLYYDL